MKSFFMFAFVTLLGCSPADRTYTTLENSEIVCEACSDEQLAEETVGIRYAARTLIEYVGGTDLLPDYSPITIHVSLDDDCPWSWDPDVSAYEVYYKICLFNIEHHQECIDTSFVCAPIDELPSQFTMIHEGLHEWFDGRLVQNYDIQEGLCQYVGLDASNVLEFMNGNGDISTDPCDRLSSEHTALMRELCAFGITSDMVRETLTETDKAAGAKGASLTEKEFAGVVSQVMGQDMEPAFQVAGIL